MCDYIDEYELEALTGCVGSLVKITKLNID